MNLVQRKFQEWLLDYCKDDPDCEKMLRDLLKRDKAVLKEINIAYEESNIYSLEMTIKKFTSNNRILIRTCKNCHKANFVHNTSLVDFKCVNCQILLFQTPTDGIISSQIIKNEKTQRCCLYCNNPVSSLPNSVTCLSCRGVSFSPY